ncbi:MAG TPA: hypothetical protein VLA98_10440, partial [Solirubrobacteraceae bacterium]|nr:hypothetical protein [Solirubrobacteraceae bacterium]
MATWVKPLAAGMATTACLIGGAGLAARIGGIEPGFSDRPAGSAAGSPQTLALAPVPPRAASRILESRPSLPRTRRPAPVTDPAGAPAATARRGDRPGGRSTSPERVPVRRRRLQAAPPDVGGVNDRPRVPAQAPAPVSGPVVPAGPVTPAPVAASSRLRLRVAQVAGGGQTAGLRLTMAVSGQDGGGTGAVPAQLEVALVVDPKSVEAARGEGDRPVALAARIDLDRPATAGATSDLRVRLKVVAGEAAAGGPVIRESPDDGAGMSNAVEVVLPLPPADGSPARPPDRQPADQPSTESAAVEVRVPVAPVSAPGDDATSGAVVPVDAAPQPGTDPAAEQPGVQVAVTVTPTAPPAPPADTPPAPPADTPP